MLFRSARDIAFEAALSQTAQEIYGKDENKILKHPDVDVHFFVGGTQTNFTLIAAALRPYQSVLSAATGHIFVHESGAIEATGHKCETLPTVDGKNLIKHRLRRA